MTDWRRSDSYDRRTSKNKFITLTFTFILRGKQEQKIYWWLMAVQKRTVYSLNWRGLTETEIVSVLKIPRDLLPVLFDFPIYEVQMAKQRFLKTSLIHLISFAGDWEIIIDIRVALFHVFIFLALFFLILLHLGNILLSTSHQEFVISSSMKVILGHYNFKMYPQEKYRTKSSYKNADIHWF